MPDAPDSLDAAARRLDEALARLEGRVLARLRREAAAPSPADRGPAAADMARLAAELDAARARERELEGVAADASAALGRAAAEVRAALQAEH
jgi:hypothetical protein